MTDKLTGSTNDTEPRTCLLAGPGRGDCEHFVGWHADTDEWGVPKGWCIVCYWQHKAAELRAENEQLRAAHDAHVEGEQCEICFPPPGAQG
jgi:hypothetical protein